MLLVTRDKWADLCNGPCLHKVSPLARKMAGVPIAQHQGLHGMHPNAHSIPCKTAIKHISNTVTLTIGGDKSSAPRAQDEGLTSLRSGKGFPRRGHVS